MSDDPRIDRRPRQHRPSRRGFLTVVAAGLGASLQPRARRAAAQTPAPPPRGRSSSGSTAPAGNQGDIVEQRAKEFAEENRGIRMKLELFPTNEYVDEGPDPRSPGSSWETCSGRSAWGPTVQWAAKGVLAPLDEYIKADKLRPEPVLQERLGRPDRQRQALRDHLQGPPGLVVALLQQGLSSRRPA